MLSHYFIAYLVAINIIAYLAMWFDKMRAVKNERRIPESNLLLIALVFGSVGIYLGMQSPVRHKSSKIKFRLGIPVLLAVNIFLIWFMEFKLF